MKRWIRAPTPGPACLVQKRRFFAQEARHLRRRGTSMCLARPRTRRFMARVGRRPMGNQLAKSGVLEHLRQTGVQYGGRNRVEVPLDVE